MKFVMKILANKKLNLERIPKMFIYPKVRREEIFDNYFDTKIQDPYKWLEDGSQETKDFMDQENSITDNYVNSCPYRDLIKGKIVDLMDFPRNSVPKLYNNLLFQWRNSGLDDQDVLYVCEKLGEEGEVFLDANKLGIKVKDYQISCNQDFCYMLDSKEIRFKDYQEVLRNAFLVCWLPNGMGIFYTNSGKLFYHKLKSQQIEDLVLVDFEDSEIEVKAVISDCDKYLVIMPTTNFDGNKVFLAKLPKEIIGKLDLTPLVENFDYNFKYLTNNGSQFLFMTNKGAKNYQIISIDFRNPNEDNWKMFVAEEEQKMLQWCQPIDKDKLILCYRKHFGQFLQLHDISSGQKLHDIQIGGGTIDSTTGGRNDSQFFYTLTSLLKPAKICKIQFENEEIHNETIQETKINNEDLEIKQILYKNKNGENIPMLLLHGLNLKLNGKNPCLLHGNDKLPKYKLHWIIFARHFKGIVAIANIRNEKLEEKQRTIDDLEYAAHYLVGCGYTSPDNLTIEGQGFLTTACANQNPNLFKAIISDNGLLDLLKNNKFSSEDQLTFENLQKYSPLHNIPVLKSGEYPATLLLTRVNHKIPCFHSLKFIAQLQHEVGCESQKNPLLVRIEGESGIKQKIDKLTDIFCFISNALNIPFYE